jgi:hypothetical protein
MFKILTNLMALVLIGFFIISGMAIYKKHIVPKKPIIIIVAPDKITII